MKELPVRRTRQVPVTRLMLYLTEDCNLRCTYCFVKKKPRRMSLETAKKAIDYFLDRNISGRARRLGLTFFGGEPFLELELMEEIIQYAYQRRRETGKRIIFAATTNATIANPRVEKLVREQRISLMVSIDGGEEAMASRPFVGGGSPFNAVARNLKRLVEWSPSVLARMTYHPEALDLTTNVRRVLELGAPAVALCQVSESDWRGYEERLEQAWVELGDWFLSEARRGRWLPLENVWVRLRRIHLSRLGAPRPARACPVGTTLLGIDPDGNVMPCHRFLYRPQDWLGTVEEPRLGPERDKYVSISSRDLLGCDDCVAEPICGGGCRLLAISERLDLHSGTHPGYCLNTRAQARMAYRVYDALMEEMPVNFTRALRRRPPVGDSFGELAS